MSDCPSQNVLRYEQRAYKQWKPMGGKRQNWISYPFFKMIIGLSFLWAWNVGVNGDPSTREDGDKAAPYNTPYGPTMRQVDAMIWLQ